MKGHTVFVSLCEERKHYGVRDIYMVIDLKEISVNQLKNSPTLPQARTGRLSSTQFAFPLVARTNMGCMAVLFRIRADCLDLLPPSFFPLHADATLIAVGAQHIVFIMQLGNGGRGGCGCR